MWIFAKELIPLHNTNIMNKQRFSNIFCRPDLLPLFCDYYGTFDLALFLPKALKERGPIIYSLSRSCHNILSKFLNIVMRVLFRDKGFECNFISPYMLFIGIKTFRDY